MHDTVASTTVTIYADDLDNPTNVALLLSRVARAAGRELPTATAESSAKAYDGAATLLAAFGLNA